MTKIFKLIPDFPMIGKGRHRREWFVRFTIHQIGGSWMADGKRIPTPFPEIVGQGEPGPITVPDYLFSINGWSLFSERFRDLIEAAFPGTIQFIPFKLIADDSVIRAGDYFIGQLLHVIDALDFDRTATMTDWARRENGTYDIDLFKPIYILERKVYDLPIFRLDGAQTFIWVGDEFRQLVIDNGITGCRFQPAHVS